MRKELTDLEKRFLSIADFSEQTGLCKQTIKSHLKNGIIRYAKIANRVLIPASELDRIEQASAFGGAVLAPVVAESVEVAR